MRTTIEATGARSFGHHDGWAVVRVLTGTVRLAQSAISLLASEGLPVGVADGIVSFHWSGELWAVADSPRAELEIIL